MWTGWKAPGSFSIMHFLFRTSRRHVRCLIVQCLSCSRVDCHYPKCALLKPVRLTDTGTKLESHKMQRSNTVRKGLRRLLMNAYRCINVLNSTETWYQSDESAVDSLWDYILLRHHTARRRYRGRTYFNICRGVR